MTGSPEPESRDDREPGAQARSPGLMVAVLLIVAAFVVLFDWAAGCLGLGAAPPEDAAPKSAQGNSPR